MADARTIVQPKLNSTIHEDGKGITYHAKTVSRSRQVIGAVFVIPLVIVGLISLFLTMASGYFFLVTLVCAGLLTLLYRWGNEPKVVPIEIDADTITFGGKTYLLEHVTSIGYEASGGLVTNGNNLQSLGATAAHFLSGTVYIQYGEETIPMVTGLKPNRVQLVYSDIIDALKKVGHDYSRAM